MVYLSFIFYLSVEQVTAQVVLNADGPGETYELINSVLAPDGDVVEVPDCGHESFGRHIDELFDEELGMNVFRFVLHVSEDDDRCKNADRQRNEIKSYRESPDNLLGVTGEEVEYRWKFKLEENLQVSSSFTHLHQLKAVDGPEDAMPTITLTARKGSPDRLELRYAESFTQETLSSVPLSEIKGKWVQVIETVTYGEPEIGSYNIVIQDAISNEELFSYSANSLRMWKTEASFIRPKWGIYRSLNSPEDLRDETVLFADFQVKELNEEEEEKEEEEGDDGEEIPLLIDDSSDVHIFPNPSNTIVTVELEKMDLYHKIKIYDASGKYYKIDQSTFPQIDISHLSKGSYFLKIEGRKVDPIFFRIIKQ